MPDTKSIPHPLDGRNSTLDAALDYLRRGWVVIDLPPRTKNPGRPGWQNERYDEEALRERLADGQEHNLSVLLGEPSCGLVDVDLDAAEARALAAEMLPKTHAVFGRAGSRGSHLLYVTDPTAKYERFENPEAEGQEDRAVLVEVRSGGQHTIFPPSVHPTGEEIAWERQGEAARIAGEELRRSVSKLAAATLLVRYWNQEGQRNEQALALVGGLVRDSWYTDEATRFVRTVAKAAGDEEWQVRGTSAVATDERQDEGKPTTGWPRLAELIGEKIVARVREWLDVTREGEQGGKQSQADLLVELADIAYLFHEPGGEAFVTIPVQEHTETHRLGTKGFKNWLRYQFFLRYGKAPGSQAVQDALGTLEGKAMFVGPEHEVHTRLAEHGGAVYLDLGNQDWEAIEVTPEGWRVVPSERVPVRFKRAKGMLPLPYPDEDGDLGGLHSLLNLKDGDEASWVLLLSWLAAALRPKGPYPVLILQGEQGSAKSTAQRMLRALVDPSTVPLRTAPREERDLLIAATNGWIVSFDNLSGLPVWLSDALCRLATGGGFGTRQLYTDQEEVLFSAMRPAMLNGITDVAARPDLLDRSLVVELPVIPEERRKTEREIWAEFAAKHPRILGALLDAVSMALKRLPEVRLEKLPRMAEFAEWVTASEEGLDLEEGVFMRAYAEARSDAVDQALEGDPVAEAVLAFMAERRQWVGPASELHKWLAPKVSEDVRRTKAWPKTPQHLSARMTRLAPPLRAVGLEYTPDAGRTGPGEPRRKRIRWAEGSGPERGYTPSSTSSTPSTPGREARRDAPSGAVVTGSMDDGDGGMDDEDRCVDDIAVRGASRPSGTLDDMDDVDDPPRVRSDDAQLPTEAEVRGVLRDPPDWLHPVLENYRDEYVRRGQIDNAEVEWRMDIRTIANNVAAALGLSPTEGHQIRPLVEKAISDSEYAREAAT